MSYNELSQTGGNEDVRNARHIYPNRIICERCYCCAGDGIDCEGACDEAGRHSRLIVMRAPLHESTRIQEAGYHSRGGLLVVRFKKGRVKLYVYYGVPRQRYERLLAAESPGKFLDAEIINRYEFRREDQIGERADANMPLWAHYLKEFRALTDFELRMVYDDINTPLAGDVPQS